jgi:hypothetical protein
MPSGEAADRYCRAQGQAEERGERDRAQADLQAEPDDLPQARFGQYSGEFLHMNRGYIYLSFT